jgi:dipeptidyl aminopeptidase/acylaminoacyl peptidase
MQRRQFLLAAPLAAAASIPPLNAGAQPAIGALPVQDFVRHDGYAALSLSPDGKSLVALIPIAGRRNVAVIDLAAKKATAITAITDRDVRTVRWINNERLVYDLIDLQSGLGEQRPSGLFAINKDGTEFKELASPNIHGANSLNFVFRFTFFLSPVPDSHHILAVSNERSADSTDVYRVDTKTGRRTLLTFSRPDRIFGWLVDDDLQARIAIGGIENTTRRTIYHRDNDKAEWTKLADFDSLDNDGFEPLAFGPDGTLYVASRGGGDRAAIHTYDIKSKKLGERLAAHKDFDFAYGNNSFQDVADFLTQRNANLIFDSKKKKLVGLRLNTEREEFFWLDDEWAKLHAMVEGALLGRINRLSRTTDQSTVLVYSYSDREPGRWYLLNPDKRTLEETIARRPWVRAEQQAERRSIRYQARDGLQIPAYLTLPAGRAAKGLPLVVLVHGGPFVRGEFWVWDAEAQLLASRGYAVLQPDYRGSLGYGWKHYAAGRRQWGLAMQDDLTDGVRSLVDQGIVDAKRVAIMGGSYGGYATMMGLAKDPELYRCGIDMVGVTDLELMGDATWSDMGAARPEFQQWFAAHVGDLKTEREKLRAVSPYLLASRIKRPVLIAHGANDRRVPIDHASKMRSALDSAKVPYEWVVYDDEAHGFLREANRFDFYGRVEQFLAKHMG